MRNEATTVVVMELPGSKAWELHPGNAHPKARDLFIEPFFWDGIDDSAPWGSDEGADALAAFGRAHRPDGEPPDAVKFALKYVGAQWLARKSVANADESALEEYSCENIAIIAISLGMVLLHGYVTPNMRSIGLEAIDRELKPEYYELFGFPEERINNLEVCRRRLLQAETREK